MSHYLEAIFYDYYQSAKRQSLDKFIPLYRVVRLMDSTPSRVKAMLIESETIKAIEVINLTNNDERILVHPDSFMKFIRNRFKRGLKSLYIEN